MDRNREIIEMAQIIKKTFPNRKTINERMLEQLFNEKKYAQLISAIKNHMGITLKISVKCINKEIHLNEEGTPAGILIPDIFPVYGSNDYQRLVLDLFIDKKVLDYFHLFVMVISHELAHVVLHSINHQLKNSEEATDITAINFGFSKFFELGHTVIYSNYFESGYRKTGYLSFEEMINVIETLKL